MNPANPQSWNRYAYVLNNPMSLTDAGGLDCVYDEGGGRTSTLIGDCSDDTDAGYYYDGSINGASIGADGMITFSDQNGQQYQFDTIGDDSYANPVFQDDVYLLQGGTETINVGGDTGLPGLGPNAQLPNSGQISPNKGDVPVGMDIWHCPDGKGHDACANSWKQANCVVSKPLENAANSTVKGAVGTAFKAGVSNGAGWAGFLPGAWNAVKAGTVTTGAAIWTYGNVMYDTAKYMVNACSGD